jgi:hypothetical protein
MRKYAPLLLAALTACGSDAPRFRIELDVQGTDALTGVVTMRVTASGPDMSPVTAEGPAERKIVDLPEVPLGQDRVITVEGLDQDAVAVSQGKSAPFDLTADSPEVVKVTFARCTTRVYLDADGDGYGVTASGKTACASNISGYVDQPGDCDDKDKQAHPGQTAYFSQPTAGGKGYDFDCDGTEEQEKDQLAGCASLGPACKGEGWGGSNVPACGQSGTYLVCQKNSGTCEEGPGTTETQACR